MAMIVADDVGEEAQGATGVLEAAEVGHFLGQDVEELGGERPARLHALVHAVEVADTGGFVGRDIIVGDGGRGRPSLVRVAVREQPEQHDPLSVLG